MFSRLQSELHAVVEELETLLAGTKPRTAHPGLRGGERVWKEEALEKGREKSDGQPDRHGNCFERQRWATSERLGGAHTGFSEREDTILN